MNKVMALIALPLLLMGQTHIAVSAGQGTTDVAQLTEATTPSPNLGEEQDTPVEAAGDLPLDDYGIYGADVAGVELIQGAMNVFARSNLLLPPLRIYVHATEAGCAGHLGLFSLGGDMHRVDICRMHETLIRHELAHAWEHHNVDDTTRQAFVDRVGAKSWNDKDEPHPTRGVEQVAHAIVWGTESAPVQGISAGHFEEELARYELLTGSPSPRLSAADDASAAPSDVTVAAMKVAAEASGPDAVRS